MNDKAPQTTTGAPQPRVKKKRKTRLKVRAGRIYIQATYNNTIVTVTDEQGNVVAWSSAGRAGFGGARKATPYAAQQVIAHVMEQLQNVGMQSAKVFVTGIGSARESAIRALSVSGMAITAIRDMTPIPHNGVRPRKRRRI